MHKELGFTLIELMITLAVAAILVGLAVPSFQTIIQNNRLAIQSNDFITALNLARSEAIKTGVRVTVCQGTAAGCVAVGGWQQGWVVFPDPDNSATRNGGEIILRVHEPLTGGNTLTGTGTAATYVSYIGTGFAQTIAPAPFVAGSLGLCDARGAADSRVIVITATGRPRVTNNAGAIAEGFPPPACP